MTERTQPPPAFGPATDQLHDEDDVYVAMQHNNGDTAFDNLTFDPDDREIPDEGNEPEDEPLSDAERIADFLGSDGPGGPTPDPKLAEPRPRTPQAKKYEKKVRGLFATGVKISAVNPRTVPDSATFLVFGPPVSEKLGDLAAVDPRVARGIDMLTEQNESPYLALAMVTLPMMLQLARNHEADLKKTEHRAVRTMRVPFTKRTIGFRFRLRLPRYLRARTQEPTVFAQSVFSNPDVVAAFRKQGFTFE